MDANVRILKENLQCTADHLRLKPISGGKLLKKIELAAATQRREEWEPGLLISVVQGRAVMKWGVRDRNWIENEVSAELLLVCVEDLLFVCEGKLPWPLTRNCVRGAQCSLPRRLSYT